MDDPEKTAYLTNLVVVARSDGRVPEGEAALLTRMAQQIGASHAQLQRALNRLGHPQVDLRGLTRLSDKIRCFEDMTEVAMADGELAVEEQRLLVQAVRDIGLGEELANRIIAEVKQRRSA